MKLLLRCKSVNPLQGVYFKQKLTLDLHITNMTIQGLLNKLDRYNFLCIIGVVLFACRYEQPATPQMFRAKLKMAANNCRLSCVKCGYSLIYCLCVLLKQKH